MPVDAIRVIRFIVTTVAWAKDWDDRISGRQCQWCSHGRPDEIDFGTRVFAGQVSDAYFARRAFVRGYAVVVWRGRHVVEPIDLSPAEADQYQREVLTVARAIRDHFQPAKLNYLTMGNWEPHLHTHVTARYPDDPGDGGPLPAKTPPLLDLRQWRTDAEAVRTLLEQIQWHASGALLHPDGHG